MKKIAEIRILDLIKQTKTYKFIWVSVIFHCQHQQQQQQKGSINVINFTFRSVIEPAFDFRLQNTQSRKSREKVGGVDRKPNLRQKKKFSKKCVWLWPKSASTRRKPPRSKKNALIGGRRTKSKEQCHIGQTPPPTSTTATTNKTPTTATATALTSTDDGITTTTANNCGEHSSLKLLGLIGGWFYFPINSRRKLWQNKNTTTTTTTARVKVRVISGNRHCRFSTVCDIAIGCSVWLFSCVRLFFCLVATRFFSDRVRASCGCAIIVVGVVASAGWSKRLCVKRLSLFLVSFVRECFSRKDRGPLLLGSRED